MIESGEPLQLQNQRDRCEQLVSEHYDRPYRRFLWFTNSADNAADLTHDTLWLCGNRWTGLTIVGRPNPGFTASPGTSGASTAPGGRPGESTRRNRPRKNQTPDRV